MRKNIILKSMLRQPLRTALLALLVGLASFTFYFRTIEYIVVREQVGELSAMYRAIGFIRTQNFWDDVSQAAEIISNSPNVAVIDQRVAVEGVLQRVEQRPYYMAPIETRELYSPDFIGMQPGASENNQMRNTDALFYATFLEKYVPTGTANPIWISAYVYYVLAGIPEHVTPGQTVSMRFFPERGEDRNAPSALAGMEIGNVYLFRTVYYVQFNALGGAHIPRVWGSFGGGWEALDLRPLNDEGLWFAPAGTGLNPEGADFSSPELAHIPDDIAFLRHHQRAVHLLPTKDMNNLPLLQPWAGLRMGYLNPMRPQLVRIRDGRLLDSRDYESANPVVVISAFMAQLRDLNIGDTLVLSIPLEQQVVGIAHNYGELVVRSTRPAPEEYHELELEIVGIYTDFERGFIPGLPLVYIPASLLPDGLVVLPPPPGVVPGWDTDGHLPSIWYSFTLSDPRTDQIFLYEYGELLSDLGFDLVIFESDSVSFWAAIDPMLLVVFFNAVVFWAVLLLVLMLVAFLFLQQRRKDMAIQLALGFSIKRVLWRIAGSVLFFVMPAVLAGGAVGWIYAIRTAEYVLAPLVDIVPGERAVFGQIIPVDLTVNISPQWFIWLGLGVLAGVLLLVLAGAVYLLRIPVLEQLQGVLSKRNKKKAAIIETEDTEPVHADFNLPTFTVAKGYKQRGRLRYIMRHITRSPVKSVLGVFVALFFVLMLGWLQESMVRTDGGIEYLFDNTIIWGEIMQEDASWVWEDRELGDIIWRHAFVDLLENEALQDVYLESGNSWSYVIKPNADGSLPENWYEAVGFDRSVNVWQIFHTFNVKFAFNDFDRFVYLNSYDDEHRLEVEFAPGFDQYSLICESGIVPIIASERVLYERDVSLGDMVYIGYATLSTTIWNHVPARIIGVHNGNIANEPAQEATFMHIHHLEELMRGAMMYSTINFNINPAYNRNIAEVREYIEGYVNNRRAALLPLRMFMNDQSFHNQIGIATQALLLLELMYPVAVGAALVIAGGLAMLLMLQNAKKAATLHVLGTSKGQTVFLLFVEQFIVCMAGVLPGVLALFVLGVSFNATLVLTFGLYLAGVFVSALLGAVVITRREPLDLLQVRE